MKPNKVFLSLLAVLFVGGLLFYSITSHQFAQVAAVIPLGTTTQPVGTTTQPMPFPVPTIAVSKDPSVPSQNIAANVPNQPLGGFRVVVTGEPVSVRRTVFRISRWAGSGSASNAQDITDVTLVNQNGTILAGPVTIAPSSPTITFPNTIVYPVGTTSVRLRGKLGTDYATNDTVGASTTPSVNWMQAKGQLSNQVITPVPSSPVTGNVMTVKRAALSISVATTPVSQTVLAPQQQFMFANYIFDASQSGEDVRITSWPFEYNVGAGFPTSLSSCTLYDNTVAITTGSHVVHPTTAASSTLFTLDGSGVVIPKGSVKVLALKCNVGGGISGKYAWGYDAISTPSATGITSGQPAVITEYDSMGQIMTVVSSGSSFSVSDGGSPGYHIVTPGQDVVLLLQYDAVLEDIDIQRVVLQLSGVFQNTPLDLVNREVKLYDAASPLVPIATAQFANNSDYATSSLFAPGAFRVPQSGPKTLLVKGTIANIATSGPLTASGDWLRVDYDGGNNGLGGNYGIGVATGATIIPTSSDTASAGVRIMKSRPTFAKLPLPSNALTAGNDRDLYRFSVTAGAMGALALEKFTFSVSAITSSPSYGMTTKYSLYAFSDPSFSTPDTAFSANGLINGGQCYNGLGNNSITPSHDSNGLSAQGEFTSGMPSVVAEIYPDQTGCNQATTTYKIPGGQTRWFRFAASIGTLKSGSGNDSLQVKLNGDDFYPYSTGTSTMFSASVVDLYGQDDLIWSPQSITTSVLLGDIDFTNGYGVPGLPASGMLQEVLSD